MAHSSAELVAGERYDAITGDFDRKAVAKALGVDVGAAVSSAGAAVGGAEDEPTGHAWLTVPSGTDVC